MSKLCLFLGGAIALISFSPSMPGVLFVPGVALFVLGVVFHLRANKKKRAASERHAQQREAHRPPVHPDHPDPRGTDAARHDAGIDPAD